jgi:hypothetical protein
MIPEATPFSTTSIEDMTESELPVTLTALDVRKAKTSKLYRYLYRIARFPEVTRILGSYSKIIDHELDRRKTFITVLISSISATVSFVSAAASIYFSLHRIAS